MADLALVWQGQKHKRRKKKTIDCDNKRNCHNLKARIKSVTERFCLKHNRFAIVVDV